MNEITNIIISGIIIIFPIMLYLVICCYLELNEKKYTNVLLIITTFTSLYLCTKCTHFISNNYVLILFNIPLIIMYIKEKEKLAIIESIFIILYSYNLDINLYYLIIKYLVYYLVYKLNKNKEYNIIIRNIAIIGSFFLSFELFIYNAYLDYQYLIYTFIISFIIYIFSFLAVYLFTLGNKVANLYTSIKLLEKEKNIKDALFKLTHEIKNPLAVCKGYLDMLNLEDDSTREKYLNIVKEEINRSLNIMNDFLMINKIKINKEEMDLSLLLDDVYNSFKIILNNQNIKLTYENITEEVYINADYDRLKQVLLNLLKNSREAIRDKGNINIKGYSDKKNIYIKVSDTGIGMSKDEVAKIKDMFYTTKESGNGIGVSISNEIIKAHDGNLEYQSVLNEGTDVLITIPI